MTINVIFFGSPAFAVPALQALVDAEGITVSLVVTQPDRPSGRGRKVTAPAVKVAATEAGIPVLQPESARDSEFVATLKSMAADLIVVVAYGELLPKSVLEAAAHGAINVHPSLLPKYRGSTPVQAAILAGDAKTGVSIIKLVRRLDAGPVIAQRTVAIDEEATTVSLSKRLAAVAADMLPEVCVDWVNGNIEPQEQAENQGSYTREWTRDDARIDWSSSAVGIARLVRASQPWPVAWTELNGMSVRIHAAREHERVAPSAPGVAQQAGKLILVSTGDGTLELEVVQPSGKQRMPAQAWWNGLRADSATFHS